MGGGEEEGVEELVTGVGEQLEMGGGGGGGGGVGDGGGGAVGDGGGRRRGWRSW